MGYRLSDIPNGHFSLEFEMAYMPAVAEAIKKDTVSRKKSGTSCALSIFSVAATLYFRMNGMIPV